ncbi:MAG: hypothetical protein IT336_14445 [Thermomicrobiales bacterium]|nr:hypothetical protein [Thermomicrobiales bacterium]
MSADSRDNLSMRLRWRAAAVAMAAFMAVGLSSSVTVMAQDATPEAMAECVAPDLPPGTPTPQDMASPVAEDMAEMDMASPVAEEEAAPAEEPVATAAEGAVADEIAAAASAIVACLDAGDYEGAVALMTTNFMMSEFDTGNPYDVALFIENFSFGEITWSNPKTYDDGSVSIEATYMGSQYQITGEVWHLVQDGDYWKLDQSDIFTPAYDGDSAVVGVQLTETENEDGTITYAITPNTPAVVQPEVLLFHGINLGTEVHEIVVFKLPEGADPMGLLDGTIAETDAEFIGAIVLAPGEEGDMVLQGLPAGVYTLVCFFPGPDGAPHIANGMFAQFEVTAPAA